MLPQMSGDFNTWMITSEERLNYDAKFQLLRPINGFLTGEQVKPFFLTFGLSVPDLGRIWTLADTDVDGKLDKSQFAIAMFLIHKRLANAPIPSSLPAGLLASSRSGFVSPLSPHSPLHPPPSTPSFTYPSHINGEFSPPVAIKQDHTASRQSDTQNWTISPEIRPKYRLIFNKNDRFKRGFITGVEAKAIFMNSGLSQQILAHIWTLADQDKDGNLNGEEFCVAMFLIDQALAGRGVPDKLPPSLMSSALRSAPNQATPTTQSECHPDEDNTASTLSFEDKRRENFLKGQAELDKRKQELAEKMRSEEEVRLEKQRQERERQERLRKEEEDRQAMEAKQEAERLKSLEAQKDLRRQQAFEQRTRAWRAAEAQRLVETERQRVESLKREKAHVQTLLEQAMAHRASLSESASVQEHRRRELSQRLLLTTTDLNAHKDAITEMRSKRDAYERDIRDLTEQVEAAKAELTRWQRQREELNLRQSTMSPTSELYKSLTANQTLHQNDIRRLNQQLTELESRLTEQGHEYAHKRTKADDLEQRSTKLQAEIDELRQALLKKLNLEGSNLKSLGDTSSFTKNPASNLDEYEVMFNFTARHPDELSLIASSLVYVHPVPPVSVPPGWLYGESDGRKGLFPESYVRKLEAGKIDPFDPFGVHRVLTSADNAFDSNFPQTQPTGPSKETSVKSTPAEFSGPPLFTCVAMFPFQSTVAGDLELSVGDVVKVYKIRDEWWEGICEQKNASGLFPASYARKLTPEELGSVGKYDLDLNAVSELSQINWPEPIVTEAAPIQSEVGQTATTGDSVPETITSDVFSPPTPTTNSVETKPELARVIAPYTATSTGQLSLQVGQVVQVRKRSPKGWWEGELQQRGRGRQYGWFPADYVQVITQPGTNGMTNNTTSDSQVGGNEKSASTPVDSATPQSNASPTVERMQAVFAYKAAHADELTFEEGAIITVLGRDEPEWWRGRLKSNGAEGLFPVNYVRPYHPTSKGTESNRSMTSVTTK